MREMIQVKVLFFSVLRDLTGVSEIEWQLPAESSMDDLVESLFERWSGLREWDASLLLAIDHDYVGREALLKEGCEVAVMPPVQGG
jgi:molybdopterin converting factor subunit 1